MNLDGTWKVKTTSGPKWFRRLDMLRDKKVISKSSGYNIAAFLIKWGKFDISEEGAEMVLTYRNGKIVDRIRIIDDNTMEGWFYLRGKRVGEFTMTRITGKSIQEDQNV